MQERASRKVRDLRQGGVGHTLVGMAGEELQPWGQTPPDPEYAEDFALVSRCVAGDRAAWGDLLRAHEAVIHFTVRSVLMSHAGHAPDHVVEDVQADVVLALVAGDCHRLRSWSGRCKLRSWLKVVAHHLTIDRLRRRKRKMVSLDDGHGALRDNLAFEGPDPETQVSNADRLARVFVLAEGLPDEDRQFLELFVVDGLDFGEIAERLGTTTGAVYARKNRVRKKLTAMYTDDCQNSRGETSKDW